MGNEQELLKELVDILRDVKNFVGNELPPLAREIVQYEYSSSLLLFSVFAAISVIGLVLYFWGNDKTKDEAMFAGVVVFIIGMIFSLVGLNGVIKVKTAPKLVAIEKISSILNLGSK